MKEPDSYHDIGLSQVDLAKALRHELGARLRGVTSFAAILVEDNAAALTDEMRETIGIVTGCAERARRQVVAISELLLLSERILKLEELNLMELANASLSKAELTGTVELAGISQWGDRELVSDIFDRLIDNAKKFSNPAEELELVITGRRLETEIEVCIKDNGKGLDSRFRETIFKPFRTLIPYDVGGTLGMGLSLARAAVHRHQGTISASSAGPDSGTTVRFSLKDGLNTGIGGACIQE